MRSRVTGITSDGRLILRLPSGRTAIVAPDEDHPCPVIETGCTWTATKCTVLRLGFSLSIFRAIEAAWSGIIPAQAEDLVAVRWPFTHIFSRKKSLP
jgi:hypothetical protein